MRKYARYEDSGISWIGDVPEHWNVVKGKRLYKRNDGGVWGDDPKNDGSDTIVLRSTEQEQDGTLKILNPAIRQLTPNERKAGMLYAGDIIITKSSGSPSHIGKASLITKSVADMCCCYSNFIQRIRIDGEPVFYWYLLNSKVTKTQFEILSTTTTGIKNLTSTIIGNIFLSVPPLSEQKAIAEYLDKKTAQINELVSAKQKQIELLKEYKQSVVANAVTGKLNKNSRMKDSGISWIGKIPENWECSTLRKHLKFVSDKGHPNEQLLSVTREQGVIIRNVESKEENHNAIPEDLSDYKLVKKGQFAINKMKSWQGSYGVSIYTGIVSPAYYVCDLDFKNKDFFSIAIRSKAYIPFFTMYSKGIRVDQWDLSPIALKTIPFFIPPAEEQNKIVSFVKDKMERIDSQIASIENQIANLNEYKQNLISDVVTGKIKVC